jgi:hypothetical protein
MVTMTTFSAHTPKPALHSTASTPLPSDPTAARPISPRWFVQRLGALLRGFLIAVKDFFVGDSGIETGWPCLWCSPVTSAVRDFIANQGDAEGWRLRVEHGGGIVGAIAARFKIDPQSIVLHGEGEHCPRARIADCSICLDVVDLDPITDSCSVDVRHIVATKRPKPRLHPAPASDAESNDLTGWSPSIGSGERPANVGRFLEKVESNK